jgi:hypothetical protein
VIRITLVASLSTALLLALSDNSSATQPAPIGWPEVISILTTQRSQAETCVGLLKSRADDATLHTTKTTYSIARTEMDGVIGGLEEVLGEGSKPDKLPNIRPALETSANKLKQICEEAAGTSTPNTKGLWDEIAKGAAEGAIEPIVNKVSDGVAAIWTHYVVEPDKLKLETRKAKLEAARWPEFSDITEK